MNPVNDQAPAVSDGLLRALIFGVVFALPCWALIVLGLVLLVAR